MASPEGKMEIDKSPVRQSCVIFYIHNLDLTCVLVLATCPATHCVLPNDRLPGNAKEGREGEKETPMNVEGAAEVGIEEVRVTTMIVPETGIETEKGTGIESVDVTEMVKEDIVAANKTDQMADTLTGTAIGIEKEKEKEKEMIVGVRETNTTVLTGTLTIGSRGKGMQISRPPNVSVQYFILGCSTLGMSSMIL